MTGPRRGLGSLSYRALVIGALTGGAVLSPVRMAQGAPRTRMAVLSAGVVAAAPARAASALPAPGPDIPPDPGPVVESPFPVSHLGVSWEGSEEAAVDVRVAGSDGAWGHWRRMLVDHDLDDDEGPTLSQIVRVDAATRLQARAAGGARHVEFVAIDTVAGPRPWILATAAPARAADPPPAEEDDVATASGPSTEGERVSQPAVVTRAQWGADESLRKSTPPKFAPIHKLFVHHTVTSPGDPDPDPASTVRAIYAYHTQANGWDDIGYNFLVDANGRIYEGRWARVYEPGEIPTGEDTLGYGVVGAQVSGHNFGSVGIAVLGDFSTIDPSSKAVAAVERMLAWKADRHEIDPEGADPFVTSDGTSEVFPNIAGHRDAGATACPGDRLYRVLPSLRARVAKVVALAHAPTRGYWTATADGRVLPFGDAQSVGSLAGRTLNAPIVGMEPTPTGAGYWLLGADGGVFSFGDARFFGSTGGMRLNRPVVRLAATPTGQGYWLVASDGGIFSFGDARFHGSTGDIRLNSPVVSMSSAPDGSGYWLVARDGGVFAFRVRYYGSVPGLNVSSYPGTVQLRSTQTGAGYYIADVAGGIFTFGDAAFHGAAATQRPPAGAVDLALTP